MCKVGRLNLLLLVLIIMSFGIANAASVITVNPVANTHNADSTANLVATFDGNVDVGNVNDTTFVVHRGFEDNPSGGFGVSSTEITFDPTYDFYPGELIQTTISTDITLNGGTPLNSAYVWQFRAGVSSGYAYFVDNGESYGTSNSRGISLGDLDGDGNLDAFVANYGQANKVWLNDGDGTFTVVAEDYGNSDSYGISLGDLDSDGDLDAYVANHNNQANKVWLNDGDGTFIVVAEDYGSYDSNDISLGDLDGDGDLDAFVANAMGEVNKVWLNDGDGTFTDNGESYGSSNGKGISLGDLDGDGDLDAFVVNEVQANKVWLNDGDGTFTDNGESYGSSNSYEISLGDLDADGDLDAFVTNITGEANKVWLNDGDGTFTDSGESYGSSNSFGISLGDLDGDGDLDAFVANLFGQANKVWLNDGDGTFTDSGENYGSSNSIGISLGDLDSDGDLDAFVANYSSQGNKVWLNVPPPPEVTTLFPVANTHSADNTTNLVATFNGNIDTSSVKDTTYVVHRAFKSPVSGNFNVVDNIITFDPDSIFYPGELIQTTITTDITLNGGTPLDTAFVWQFRTIVNSGSAYFVENGESYGTSWWTSDIILGDLDGDGDLDAFVANTVAQPNKVWLNDGDGTFTMSAENYGSSNSRYITLGDLDGDGDLDAFIANDGQANKVWLNDGDGTFTDNGENYGTSNSTDISLGDLDGDGDLDAFVANDTGQTNKVWLNDGDGTFTESAESYGSFWSTGVSLGDLDSDGDLDTFVANYSGEANKVWLNDGDGTFTDNGESYGSSDGWDISLGDLDNDGDLDAFVTNINGQANKVWLNDGDGTFTDNGESYGTSDSYSISLGDLDADGYLDAFVANYGEANKVWLNDGDGTFTDNGASYGSSDSRSINLGDLDGDGDLDAFVVNFAEADKVWLNNNPPIAFNNTVNTDEDTDKVFAKSEFNFADVDGDTLTQIQITTLETIGSLYLDANSNGTNDGEDIILNQIITVDNIPKLKFKPNANENGSPYDSYKFKVYDGLEYSDSSYTMTINVIIVNDTPIITGQVPLSTPEETELTITLNDLTVNDPDNTYPADFTLFVYDGANYTHSDSSITPIADFNDTLIVPIRVFDSVDTSIVFNLEIEVTAVNDTPFISSIPPDSTIKGILYTYQVLTTDVDDTNLFYNMITAPNSMTIDTSGLIEWVSSDTGNYNIELEVSDGHTKATDTQFYILTVYAPDTLYVPVDYITLQGALENAQEGNIILVASGIYNENLVWPVIPSIKLISESGAENTIIDGTSGYNVIYIDSLNTIVDTTTIIDGFTITGGNANGGKGIADRNGGGIYINGGSPTIRNSIITNNSAIDYGGGIYYTNDSSPIIEDNRISSNSATNGGGIYWGDASSGMLNRNTISGNSANSGGGIYWGDASSGMLNRNTISGNSANSGGGIYWGDASSGMLNRNTISGNSANSGGGIYWGDASSGMLNKNIISNNLAVNNGGGIYFQNPTIIADTIRISNNTIINNSAANGGGIYRTDANSCIILGDYPNFTNNIYHNYPDNYYNNDISFTEADFNYWGNFTLSEVVSTFEGDGAGNIDYDTLATEPYEIEQYANAIDTLYFAELTLSINSIIGEDIISVKTYIDTLPADTANASATFIDKFWIVKVEYYISSLETNIIFYYDTSEVTLETDILGLARWDSTDWYYYYSIVDTLNNSISYIASTIDECKGMWFLVTSMPTYTAPTNLQAQAIDDKINLTWDAPIAKATKTLSNYNIYRSTTLDSNYTIIDTTSNLAYNDTMITNAILYYYKVSAVYINPNSESVFSNIDSAAIFLAPTNLVATGGDGFIDLIWDAPNKGLSFYNVYRSTISGSGYAKIDTTSDIIYTNYAIAYDTSYYYVITAYYINPIGESAYSNEDSAMVASSISELEVPISTTYGLSQNYPNPFNPITIIKYQLPENTEVKLNIYNIKGQLVKTLVNEKQDAKYYNIAWNGTDNYGKEVASGLYIYRIIAGDFIETKKMLMLK